MKDLVNKEQFDNIYNIGLIKIFSSKKTNYYNVKPLLQKAMEEFNIDNLDDVNIYPIKDYNPYINIVNDIIYKALPNNPLWFGIFRISQTEISNNYKHSSSLYEYAFRYTMYVKSKKDILESLNPSWVYENHKLVDDFMSDTNELYNKLTKFSSDNFPIILKEDD